MDELSSKIIIAIITAAVTIFGTWVVSGFTNRNNRAERERERRRHAEYLAVRMVCILDPFVERCVSVTGDDGEENHNDGGYYRATVALPVLTLPNDIEWKSIEPKLMYRIISLQNELDFANRVINESFDDPPDFRLGFRERQYQYARIGTLALDIAVELRERYRIPSPDYSQWDPRKYLDKVFVAEHKLREEAAEMIRKYEQTNGPVPTYGTNSRF